MLFVLGQGLERSGSGVGELSGDEGAGGRCVSSLLFYIDLLLTAPDGYLDPLCNERLLFLLLDLIRTPMYCLALLPSGEAIGDGS